MMFRIGLPCPACGRAIETEVEIEASTLADRPGEGRWVGGRLVCPSGCDPRFRRIVVAPTKIAFDAMCHDRQWNPRRVIYVNGNDRRGAHALRGREIHPEMITVIEPVSEEIRETIMTHLSRHDQAYARSFPSTPTGQDQPEEHDPFHWGDAMHWTPETHHVV
jgi:hypothetical protein